MQKWKVSKLCFELLNLSSALCLCLVPPLFFFLFLISLFLKCTNTHTHTYVYVLSAGSLTQSCPTLCNPMNCSLPNASVYRILQARILEWVAMLFSICTNSFQKKVINVYILFECTHSLVKDCKFIDKFHEESRSIISQILSYLGGEGQCIYHDMFNQIA